MKDFLFELPEDQPPLDRLRASKFEDRSPFFEWARSASMNKAAFVKK